MKNRFLHLLLSMNLNSSSDEENSYNSSTSYDDVNLFKIIACLFH